MPYRPLTWKRIIRPAIFTHQTAGCFPNCRNQIFYRFIRPFMLDLVLWQSALVPDLIHWAGPE